MMPEKNPQIKEIEEVANPRLDFGRLGPLKTLIEQGRFRVCRFLQKPYFGSYLAARQGDPRRHFYLDKIVERRSGAVRPVNELSILEIGSWAGGSAIVLAKAIKKYNKGKGKITCVDPWRSYFNLERNKFSVYREMDEAVQNDQIYKLFLHNIKATQNGHIVTPLRGKSCDILPTLKNRRFDIVYIDGSHSYSDVLIDLTCSGDLVADAGFLCGDDLELQAGEVDLDFAKENKDKDYVRDPKTKRFYHPGVTLAIAEFFGPVSAWEGFWGMKRNGKTWDKIDLSGPG